MAARNAVPSNLKRRTMDFDELLRKAQIANPQEQWAPEVIEVLPGIDINFIQNETHVTMQLLCRKTFRVIQIPFDRIAFAGFVRSINSVLGDSNGAQG